jgi:guanylate kinase
MSGKLIIFSAPSAAGKSTLVHYLLTKDYGLEFSISATCRAPRGNEREGIDYYFLTYEEFRKRIDQNEFLEYEEVYPGCFYGTLLSEVKRITDKGKNVIFDVDVCGGLNIKKHFGAQALAIFIAPPSMEVLHQRLIDRGTDSGEMIAKRMEKAHYEMTFAPQFDTIIVNDNLEETKLITEKTVQEFLSF